MSKSRPSNETFCAALGVLLLVVTTSAPAVSAATEGPVRPELDLVLIPPSLVTDRIVLDVRAALWNRGEAARTYDVAVYLNRETPENLLHRERVTVAAGKAAAAGFRWPTRDHAGKHEMLLICRSGDQVLRTRRPLEIIASKTRSTRRIGGAWVEFYHWSEREGYLWNGEIKRMTDAEWREVPKAMHETGMNVIIIQDSLRHFDRPWHRYEPHNFATRPFTGKAMYPSRIFDRAHDAGLLAAADPVEAMMSTADELGMSVFVGVGNYAFFDFGPHSLEWHKRVARELWELYGHHRSFYGWYVTEEKDGGLGNEEERREIIDFFKEFTPYVRSLAPGKPVMLATNSNAVLSAEAAYAELLPQLDIIAPFGFHRLPGGMEAAAALQQWCDDGGSHLWMDVEVFLFDQRGGLYPRPIEQIVGDLLQYDNFEQISCYSFTGLMNAPWQTRKPGGEATVKLFRDYAKFLDEGPRQLTVAHAAKGKPVALAHGCDPRYPGCGPATLTDGRRATANYLDRGWQGFEHTDVEATVDLGQAVAMNEIGVSFLQHTTGGIYLPERMAVSLSDDGKTFRPAGEVKHDVAKSRVGPLIQTLTVDGRGAPARYVRVVAKSGGQWLFVDEITVNRLKLKRIKPDASQQ